MPRVEMVISRSPMASRQRLPSSARSWPLVVCQKNGSKLSKPRSAISPMRSAALPAEAETIVPMRMDFAGSLKVLFLEFDGHTLSLARAFNRGKDHGEALDVVG